MDAPALEPHDLLIRGVRVRYAEAGRGRPLLLLHGFMFNSRAWHPIVPFLAPRFRLIALDFPGFGDSEKPASFRYDREGFAETVCDVMAGLDISRAHVAGHSLGGAVALVLAADHPERVDRLAVINAISYPYTPPFGARAALAPVVGALWFKQLLTRPMFRAYFRNHVYAPGATIDMATVDAYYDAFKTADAREAAWQALPSTSDLTSLGPKIPKVRAPTVILWGESDPTLPLSLALRLAREIPGSRLETLPGVGHAPPEESPSRTAEILARHFEAR